LENEFNTINNINAMHSNFSIIHINARSLNKNTEMLHTYLNSLHHQFTVIAVTETWGTESKSDFLYLDGYTRFIKNKKQKKNRTNSRGGGVALFIKILSLLSLGMTLMNLIMRVLNTSLLKCLTQMVDVH
jgi:hypothetical protein